MKRAVALAIRNPADPSQLLVVLRPKDDEELPGVWGLPAASLGPGETDEEGALRVGRQKLGTPVHMGPRVAKGSRGRGDGELEMSVFLATLDRKPVALHQGRDAGVTYYTRWRWAGPEALEEGARQGSLCCQLFLQYLREA